MFAIQSITKYTKCFLSYLSRYAQNVTNIEALPYPITLPEFIPSHQSWALTDALKDYAWTQKMLPSFGPIDMSTVYGDTHQHSNGTCAQIGWLSDTGYNNMDGKGWAIHYVEQFVKRDGGLPVAWVESIIEGTYIIHSRNLFQFFSKIIKTQESFL